MTFSEYGIPVPGNEPPIDYSAGSPHWTALSAELAQRLAEPATVPLIIGGLEITTAEHKSIVCPHDHGVSLGQASQATPEHVEMAVHAAREAAPVWSGLPWKDRAAVFLKAAELLSTRYRRAIVAATMLGQSKTAVQAELEAVCELSDFWRFNPYYMARIMRENDLVQAPGTWNRIEYRPLEGFVFAVTPFNFTAIAGNLPTAPAMMGNVVLWKPASSSLLSSYLLMKILREAGLPDGVINFLPGAGASVGGPVLDRPELSGLHFTGSTDTFNHMWGKIGANIARGVYRTYPRVVGETGGKGFIMAAPDADLPALAAALLHGAFEYQGQKCSAASRAYIPRGLWPDLLAMLSEAIGALRVTDVTDPNAFMGAVIDRASYSKLERSIAQAASAARARVVIGGRCDDSKGYFVHPTVIETSDPQYVTMREELFGPVLTVYPYEEDTFEETLDLLDITSPYALTGAVFARDRNLITHMVKRLSQSAGNFYINDKPTGAVVGQQPFGGARLSGTNDKAGSSLNLLRWTSLRVLKEKF
ncbi:L-glutamate gamma-semialdehyde dehydrogenase [bacterium]|nr:L-glutamate gamma-semialdehyde dehydrogenase [candidate division CSSED10-310 bacterium]